MKVAKVTE